MILNIFPFFGNKKVKVKFLTTSGKKVCTVKFTKDEFAMIEMAATSEGQTIEEFFRKLLEDLK